MIFGLHMSFFSIPVSKNKNLLKIWAITGEILAELCFMIYSRYFKAIIREGGIGSLEPKTIAQIMNIIHLEGKLEGMNVLKEKMKDSSEPYKFDFDILKVKSHLSSITGDLQPKELLRRFYEQSRGEM